MNNDGILQRFETFLVAVLVSDYTSGILSSSIVRLYLPYSAIFSSVTQTQTRTQLARVWLEYESSGIKLSVSGA